MTLVAAMLIFKTMFAKAGSIAAACVDFFFTPIAFVKLAFIPRKTGNLARAVIEGEDNCNVYINCWSRASPAFLMVYSFRLQVYILKRINCITKYYSRYHRGASRHVVAIIMVFVGDMSTIVCSAVKGLSSSLQLCLGYCSVEKQHLYIQKVT